MNQLLISNAQSDLHKLNSLIEQQHYAEAARLSEQVIVQYGELLQASNLKAQVENMHYVSRAHSAMPGDNYEVWLKKLHQIIQPNLYLEIGVETGKSLAWAKQKAIGIDPALKISHSLAAWSKVFAQESDVFFAREDIQQVFGDDKIDLAFIDGLHTFDQALRDFLNVEQFAHENTIAVFHDIYPVTPITAERERVSHFWLGDTWKVVPLLKQARPDLTIFTIPAYPSGLTLVSGLKPKLSIDMQAFIEQWMPVTLSDLGEVTLSETLNVWSIDQVNQFFSTRFK